MRTRLKSLHRNERGQIMIFGMLTILFVLVMGGLATDYAHLFLVDDELEKSMDACCLAGAGKLGFDDTAFPVARKFAREFALRNAYRAKGFIGDITLDHDGNAGDAWQSWDSQETPYGEITLGVWNPTKADGIGPGLRFEPSTDGTVVNAVMCRYKAQLPTTLFGIWGHRFFNIGATAIATANPPQTPPPDGCLFPIGVGSCPFQGNTSLGCGAPITFITSSGSEGDEGAGCLSPPCTNTSAWVNLEGGSVNTGYLKDAIEGAASGACPATDRETGDDIPTGNGMNQAVMDTLETVFIDIYNASAEAPVTIENSDGDTVYEGQGWKVYIPVIETECPAGAISGDHKIVGWTEFVMTQVINKGKCAVANHYEGNAWDAIGEAPNCLGTNVPSNSGALRAIFGYYSCTIIPSNPVPEPGPRSALATKLQLVK